MSKEEKIVVTISNEELPISQCREFQGSYYKIGDINKPNSGDCYQVDGKFYRFETGKLVFDNEYNQYVLKSGALTNGVIDFKNNELVYGYFTVIAKKNIEIITPTGTCYGLNANIFSNTKLYRERLSDGKFYHISTLSANKFNEIVKPPQEYKTSLPYDSKTVLKYAVENYDKLEIPITNTNIDKYSPILKDYTFGLEFETTAGLIPNRLLEQSSLIPLRDGSISGIEYVTVPLSGSKGLQSIVNDCKLLKERTIYDDSCSLHLHIGGVPRTKEFILAFFRTMCFMQDEIFSLFPLYKKYNFGIKNKNYCAPFPSVKLLAEMDSKINDNNINQNFDVLFKFLSCGNSSFVDYNYDLDNIHHHPADPEGTQKWNVYSRYCIVNLIPLIFGNKQTIEFRIHTPTFNADKIIAFIYMNTILVEFVQRYQRKILANSTYLNGYTLMDVIYNTNIDGTICDWLSSYMNNRRTKMEQSNKISKLMVDEDSIPANLRLRFSTNNKKNVDSPEIKSFDAANLSWFKTIEQDMKFWNPSLAESSQQNTGKSVVEQMNKYSSYLNSTGMSYLTSNAIKAIPKKKSNPDNENLPW